MTFMRKILSVFYVGLILLAAAMPAARAA
ncbi:hypothetical protein MNBD_ALPHA11-713, partial [hydrothermal vent metagenome]